MNEVATLPADKQVEAVTHKLQELNPQFDGNVASADGKGTPKIENGMVTELSFLTSVVRDISPVRALTGLKVLNCSGSRERKGRLVDLSPLRGMRLTELNCSDTTVADLSPLQGMPLTSLKCFHTWVSDLSPLRGLPLTYLSFHGSKVTDLSPLQGLPLTYLACGTGRISDLSPLKGMPLKNLDFTGTSVNDLLPLADMPTLRNVRMNYTKVTPAQVAALQKALPNCKIEWV